MLEQLIALVSYIVMLSVAAERFTDIVKRAVFSKFNIPQLEGAVPQVIAAAFGGVVAYATPPEITFFPVKPEMIPPLIALAVSGGSGAWNSILTALKELSVAKPATVIDTTSSQAATPASATQKQ